MDVFKKAGFQIYLVGGAVRHLIEGKKAKNWDFTTSADPVEIQKLFKDSFYNNIYGTVSVKMNDSIFEVTPFRSESDYKDRRHPSKIVWAKTLKEDLKRRDFTIGSIAFDGEKIIDPHNGREDLKRKLVRAVGDPDKRFSEDALRLIRAVRLASQLGFLIEKKTRASIKKNAHLIKKISAERIRDELFKILSSDNPSEGMLFLRNTGLLKYFLPELDACFEVPQKSPRRHHIFDVGTHSVMSLKHCRSYDVITRFATLIHDIGKAETYKKDKKTGLITFHSHEVTGTRLAKKIADRLKLSKKEKDKLVRLVRHHQFSVSEHQTDSAIRRFIRQVGKECLVDMLALRTADRVGSGAKPTSWRYELFKKRLEQVQKEPFKVTDLKVSGDDVMERLNLKPGPAVGKVLKKIFDEVVEGRVKNERKELLKKLKKISNS